MPLFPSSFQSFRPETGVSLVPPQLQISHQTTLPATPELGASCAKMQIQKASSMMRSNRFLEGDRSFQPSFPKSHNPFTTTNSGYFISQQGRVSSRCL